MNSKKSPTAKASAPHYKTIYDALGREPVHPFPARMAPGIAFDVLSEPSKPLRVLDPLMGSGTVLALARSQGHQSFGIDIDPLAVLIARVWTTSIDPEAVRDVAKDALADARAQFTRLTARNAYPYAADEETRAFIRYWFDTYSRRQLAALSYSVADIADDAVRDVLWCAFSRLIITKQSGASLAMDLSHSRPHKAFKTAPTKPFRKFESAVERVVTNCISIRDRARGPAPSLREGDARRLPFAKDSIDLVLTSPPYLNAIDYMRCSKFSLVWMGYTIEALRRLRSSSVGSEASGPEPASDLSDEVIDALKLTPTLSARDQRILARYIDDMAASVGQVARVLSPSGKAVYVIGENTIRGTYVRNSKLVSEVARHSGLKLVDSTVRELPANRRYLPPPSSTGATAALDARMRREVILSFEKRA
ncbi:MAG: hypothetical protein QOC81_3464 [Thermoanaerobaculia bacterium]|jgi:DNA modification methylase|nr:hypothetical protein [Thermoanaerobaculia bacterium]